MSTIGILGVGVMGTGIAQLAAQSGHAVILRDLKQSLLKDSINTIAGNLDRQVDERVLEQVDRDLILQRIQGSLDLADMVDCDMVIESVVENMAVKKQLFAELDTICPEHTIFASTTDSLSITEIAASTKRPDRVLGMHFQNSVLEVELVELIRGLDTSDNSVNIAKDMIKYLDKEYIIVNRDYPGYVVNRILLTYINEAIHLLGENKVSVEDIDACMRMGAGMKEGPLELADRIGLDNIRDNLESFCQAYGDFRYHPHPYLYSMIRAGRLGQKSGRGFYIYK